MAVIWSRKASADLEDIDAYFHAINPRHAARVTTAAVRAGHFLARFPGAGSPIAGSLLRKWSVQSTPYIILYRATDEHVRIVRLVHAARDWQRFVD